MQNTHKHEQAADSGERAQLGIVTNLWVFFGSQGRRPGIICLKNKRRDATGR
jgi:hypothetical protein